MSDLPTITQCCEAEPNFYQMTDYQAGLTLDQIEEAIEGWKEKR